MEIIEKQIEKVKEVPCGYWDNCGYNYPYNRTWGTNQIPASRGVAGAGLGLN